MIKGAIFDLDGTLLDSMHIWHYIDCAFLGECGISVPHDLEETLKTMTIDQCVDYFIDVLGVKHSKEYIINRISALMREMYLKDIEAKPFVRRALDRLRKKNIKMCIATANDYELTCETLKRLDLSEYFNFVATCGQLCCSKTQPDIFLHCAQRLGLKPQETAVFEDSLHCVEAAKSAGFYVIGVYDEFSKEDTQKIKEKSDKFIYTFEGEFL